MDPVDGLVQISKNGGDGEGDVEGDESGGGGVGVAAEEGEEEAGERVGVGGGDAEAVEGGEDEAVDGGEGGEVGRREVEELEVGIQDHVVARWHVEWVHNVEVLDANEEAVIGLVGVAACPMGDGGSADEAIASEGPSASVAFCGTASHRLRKYQLRKLSTAAFHF